MRLKLNRAAALTLTGTAILATLSQVGGAADRSYIEGHSQQSINKNIVKANIITNTDHPALFDNSQTTNDVNKVKSFSMMPNGFHWTNAGYIRNSNTNGLTTDGVVSSNIQLGEQDQKNIIFNKMMISRYPSQFIWTSATGSFELNKDQLTNGKDIIVGSVVSTTNQSDHLGFINYINGENQRFPLKLKDGTELGTLEWIHPDANTVYFVFHITASNDYLKKISTNPKLEYSIPSVFIYNYVNKYSDYHGINWDTEKNSLYTYFVTPSEIDTIKLYKYHTGTMYITNTMSNAGGSNWSTGPNGNAQYSTNGNEFWSFNGALPYDISKIPDHNRTTPLKRVIKFTGNNIVPAVTGMNTQVNIPVVGVDGKSIHEVAPVEDEHKSAKLININTEQKADNMSATDLYNSVPDNTAYWSKQSDGSVIVAWKLNPNSYKVTDDQIKEALNDHSYSYNIEYPEQKTLIQKNTLDFMHRQDNVASVVENGIFFNRKDTTKGNTLICTDLTPVRDNAGTDINSSLSLSSGASAELYRIALVHYIDSNTGNNVSDDSVMGTKDSSTDYKVNIPKNYVLDTKSGKNKDGTQYKWSADKKSIAYTFNEDQKLIDANPINIYITHGTHNTNDNSGKSTRTIQYTGLPDNLKPKDNVQTILFKRSGVTDDVTGETTYGDWQPQAGNGHYTAVTSPTFAGYKPDQTVVPDTAATAGKDETVTVNYSRTNQNAKLTVHDDTANTDLNDYAENSTGLYQDQINFKTAPSAIEQELKDQGYNIVSDSFKGSPTYNADDSKNNFVIHVTHKIVPVTPDQPKTPNDVIPDTKQHYPTGVNTNDLNKDVQRSIFYKYEDNSQAEPTVVQKAHFDRTVKVDAVTQKIVDPGNWSTKDNYPEVATKSIDGYTPDKTKVDSATPSMTTNQDQTVVYHANDEDAAITYIDNTTGKVLKTDTQKAKYKQTIKFATDPNTQIQTYKDQGYVLVSSDWKDGSIYQTDPVRNKFTVHLKHGTSTVTPDNPKTPTDIIPGTKQHYPTGVDTNDLNQPQQRQITYTYADSKKQASPTVTQKATFHRTATVDNVTGKTTYTDWTTSDQYPEVKSPTIEGYTPDRSNIPVTKPVLNTKQNVAVTYNPNPEQIDVIAQDNTGKQLSKSTLHGNYNTDYSAITPVIKGYHLIKMPANTHGTYKTHNDPIIYIYAPDSNTVPEQTDGTPKPDKSSYPNDLTPAKRSTKLPETGSINLASEINSALIKVIHNLF